MLKTALALTTKIRDAASCDDAVAYLDELATLLSGLDRIAPLLPRIPLPVQAALHRLSQRWREPHRAALIALNTVADPSARRRAYEVLSPIRTAVDRTMYAIAIIGGEPAILAEADER